MAKKNFRHIPAVKQKDGYACWAACMKWWLRAQRSVYKSQTKLIDENIDLTNLDGAVEPPQMRTFIQRQGLNRDEPTSMNFTVARLKDHLSYSPLFVAYVTDDQKLHVNVIYELVAEQSGSIERYSQVRVMEPQEFSGGYDWKGVHKIKNLGDFTWFGTCMIGSLRPASAN